MRTHVKICLVVASMSVREAVTRATVEIVLFKERGHAHVGRDSMREFHAMLPCHYAAPPVIRCWAVASTSVQRGAIEDPALRPAGLSL